MVIEPVVLGIDAGGTATRAVVAALDGARFARGRAGGGNPIAHGVAAACAALSHAAAQALRGYAEALGETGVPRVVAGTAAVAGDGPLRHGEGRAAFERVWYDLGIEAEVRCAKDVAVAFAAGTAEASGSVLLAGTGAVAAAIADRRLAGVADGLGWLLGDHGSGYWLGREAAAKAVADLTRGVPSGPLTRLITGALIGESEAGGRDLAMLIIRHAQGRPPLELSRLAPLVNRAAEEGDPGAAEIVAEAARLLVETVSEVRPAGAREPIVLAGSVLTSRGPVRRAVCDLLRERWDASVSVAGDGAGAAAWLAALDLLGEDAAPPHGTFTGRPEVG
ncbi:BadF/BadG/BcrA/BcrD ATPase family protein [Spongiactinospora sp. TRM90649]|uniref:N-acetylglucosamine kinase n=1 Tax=Spongiactinospora sp. TRM90649 TaxID=3031114 RepID=UPI0023F7E919|nr:BadF/BadG/BcrA/BcrD ATPase family protein [Spongiactinospora sp. TRM90649]MDF5753961.1 BadF/BadG/BcrA/BcrD ATPase family protein [Spongiactinospora sp. TRM90649]